MSHCLCQQPCRNLWQSPDCDPRSTPDCHAPTSDMRRGDTRGWRTDLALDRGGLTSIPGWGSITLGRATPYRSRAAEVEPRRRQVDVFTSSSVLHSHPETRSVGDLLQADMQHGYSIAT